MSIVPKPPNSNKANYGSSGEVAEPTPTNATNHPTTSSSRLSASLVHAKRLLQRLTANDKFSEFIGSDPAQVRTLVPTITLGLWLSAFWYLSEPSSHRWMLSWLVIPSLLFLVRELPTIFKSARWLWLATALLIWQTLSHSWSGGGNDPPGAGLDSLIVFGLIVALIGAARGPALIKVVFPALAVLSAMTSALHLIIFYLPAMRNFTEHRLRNIFFYEDGLNAVLTGFLFAFGAIIAAWLTIQTASRLPRIIHSSALSLSLLGLLATQSRGPMLMFFVGLLCLIIFERKRLRTPLIATASTILVYFSIFFMANYGQEASLDLFQRGSTGRFEIYQSFLKSMDTQDIFIGTGMGHAPELPEETLGWLVHHPHSVYLTQFYQTGIIGAALLLAVIALAARCALKLARHGESLWLSLLAGGCLAFIFDGGQVFTVYSTARIEILMIAVPAALAVGRASFDNRLVSKFSA